MATTLERGSQKVTGSPGLATGARRNRILAVAAVLSLIVGLGSVAGGIFGAVYTWNQAVAENIVTPPDAAIPETPVRGPFTMKAQADIIVEHTLDNTDGLRYAEMPRFVPQLDDAGNPVLDENGEPVMVPNQARNIWITATTLTTALNLGIMAYALSALAFFSGVVLILIGLALWSLRSPPERITA